MKDIKTRLLAASASRLIEQGNRAPTLVEIACDASNLPPPSGNPWQIPEGLSEEAVEEVHRHLPLMREIMEEEKEIAVTPVCAYFYIAGLHKADPKDELQVYASLAQSSKTVGIRQVEANKNDPFYMAYLASLGERASGTLGKTTRRLATAMSNGAIDASAGHKALGRFSDRVGVDALKAITEAPNTEAAAE